MATQRAPMTVYIQVPDNDRRMMLKTWVSRVVRPSDFGIRDNRYLGLLVRWDFVDKPAADGAAVKATKGGVA